MKNNIGNFLDQKTIANLKQVGVDGNYLVAENILGKARQLDYNKDKNRYIIHHEQHNVFYYPDDKIIKLFFNEEKIYTCNIKSETDAAKLAQGLNIEQMIVQKIPMVKSRIISDKAATSIRVFLDEMRMENLKRLRTTIQINGIERK